MDQVKSTHEEIIIPQHTQPINKDVVDEPDTSSFIGYMKGSVIVTGDIIAPVDEDWAVRTNGHPI